MQYGLSDDYADDLPFIREILFDVQDDTPRLIYADWLDERSDARSEFIRLDMVLGQVGMTDEERSRLRQRRSVLLPSLDPQWVSLLARAPIERCPQKIKFQFMCPQRWENLHPFGDDQSVRYCDQCGRSVTYCFTIAEAREQASKRQCVAIDASVHRSRDDLNRAEPDYYTALLGLIAEES